MKIGNQLSDDLRVDPRTTVEDAIKPLASPQTRELVRHHSWISVWVTVWEEVWDPLWDQVWEGAVR